jgi:Beta-propeller repeat
MHRSHRILFVLILFVIALAASLVGPTADARAAASGTRLWAKVVTRVSTAGGDEILSVAPGPGGSVYACGVYKEPAFTGYLWVARYSSGGHLLWLHKYGESLGIDANANAIAVDGQGDLIVVGQAVVAGNTNALTLKYAPDGTLRWAKQFDGAVSGQDFASAVAVDSAGGIYVAGATTQVGTGLDYLVVKYDAAGHRRLEATYGGVGGDVVNAIAVGAAGSVYVTGTSLNAGGDTDCVTAKLGSNGPWKWFRTYASPGGFDDGGRQIAVSAGGVYVDGTKGGAGGDEDVLLLKYATGGARVWSRTWDGPAHLADIGLSLAVDAAGDAWVAGSSGVSGGLEMAVLIKWDSAGHRKWAQTYTHAGVTYSEFTGVVVDSSGHAWCAGERSVGLYNGDFLVVKYADDGVRLWAHSWDGPAHQDDGASCLCFSGSGGLYVGGRVVRPATGIDPALLKYQR